ncbi:TIGR04222 domain-containing membrane protein [Modestobacter excelsi]|uniref:TIGR04222 domain-containing membrane protein n=1 Tax=Modestobacter excelsi TaxID=2213161 RepID=UPI001C20C88A|nr:TIGR04222 domain-containing membrane protein [Modestobacter excelsi]
MTGTRSPLLPTGDVYDVAQLAGGLPRVVDTAVVSLLQQGRLRVDDSGRLHATGSTPGRPVESAVLDLAGRRPRRSIASMRLRAQEDPRLTGVADRLVAAGLLRRNPLAGLSSSWPAHLRTAAGRRVLEEWRAASPVGAAEVALGGPERMADRTLYESVFGAVSWAPGTARRPDRYSQAAIEANGRQSWAYGSFGLGGWGGDGGGGGFGGGFGGGDGGGCGGGDGGGGGC